MITKPSPPVTQILGKLISSLFCHLRGVRVGMGLFFSYVSACVFRCFLHSQGRKRMLESAMLPPEQAFLPIARVLHGALPPWQGNQKKKKRNTYTNSNLSLHNLRTTKPKF